MAGTLFVVATPIGNLEDLSDRARRVLGAANLVAAEDTRHTRKLLGHLGLATPTTSLYAQNEHRKTPSLVARLASGADIALVSDAGTPTVSDPGRRLVAAAREAGIAVVPVPGPSAMLAALSSSGFDAGRFRFEGFAPRKPGARRAWLAELADCDDTVVFFEAPHRIAGTLSDLAAVIGDRPIFIAREISKFHEESVKGPTSILLNTLKQPLKGEITVVVGPRDRVAPPAPHVSPAAVRQLFCQTTKTTGLSRREAIRRVADQLGLSARQVYGLIEKAKEGGHS